MLSIDSIEALLVVLDDHRPDEDEEISAREHALQCAHILAEEAPEDLELQIAGLVHDVASSMTPRPPGDHAVLGAHLVRPLFGDRVADLVGGHIAAKRYLIATDPSYAGILSAGSAMTLARQGGGMSPAEIAQFESSVHARDWVRLRRADDRAKVIGRQVPGLEFWRAKLRDRGMSASTDSEYAFRRRTRAD